MKTVFTSSGLTPARCSAAWMAVAPSRGAGTAASDPRNAPIGVRAAPTITTFFPWDGMAHSSRGGRRRFITRTWLSSRSARPGVASTGHGAVGRAGIGFSLPILPGRTNLRGPMGHAGDLSAEELDAILDRGGGPAVVVHGGAGTRPDHDPTPYLAGTRAAAEAGLRVLMQGGSALDAAQAAAVVLEDDPSFNAGTGACLTALGDVELDASCMDGTTLRAGAVACVKTMKNPILAARRVCDDTPHVLLCGPGAEAFARECGIPEIANAALVTPRQRARWEELHEQAKREGADSVRRKLG